MLNQYLWAPNSCSSKTYWFLFNFHRDPEKIAITIFVLDLRQMRWKVRWPPLEVTDLATWMSPQMHLLSTSCVCKNHSPIWRPPFLWPGLAWPEHFAGYLLSGTAPLPDLPSLASKAPSTCHCVCLCLLLEPWPPGGQGLAPIQFFKIMPLVWS